MRGIRFLTPKSARVHALISEGQQITPLASPFSPKFFLKLSYSAYQHASILELEYIPISTKQHHQHLGRMGYESQQTWGKVGRNMPRDDPSMETREAQS